MTHPPPPPFAILFVKVVFKLPEDAALTTRAEANGTPLLELSAVGG